MVWKVQYYILLDSLLLIASSCHLNMVSPKSNTSQQAVAATSKMHALKKLSVSYTVQLQNTSYLKPKTNYKTKFSACHNIMQEVIIIIMHKHGACTRGRSRSRGTFQDCQIAHKLYKQLYYCERLNSVPLHCTWIERIITLPVSCTYNVCTKRQK